MDYQNFDLLIEQLSATAGAYRARVVRSPEGDARVDFELPFATDELHAFDWLVTRNFRHLAVVKEGRVPTEPFNPRQFGTRLFDAVFQGKVRDLLIGSLRRAEAQGTGLRIRLQLEDAELAALPWEYLYFQSAEQFLALNSNTPLVRYLIMDRGVRQPQLIPPLRILVMVAQPKDALGLKVEDEWQRLNLALQDLQQRDLIVIERLAAPTFSALQDRLRGEPVHIFHFIGHGYFEPDPQAEASGLVFADENGNSDLVSAEQLGTLLRDHPSLALVFLNACEGARNGRDDAFSGTGQRLVQQGIPAVVAMQFPISDQAAILLAHEFYAAVADGYALEAALTEARKAVYGKDNLTEWATPVLFSRLEDNRLIDPEIMKPVVLADYVLTAYPKRKADLEELERVIDANQKVSGFIFAPRRLTLHDHVEVEQSVYAGAILVVGKRCRLRHNVLGADTVVLDKGTVVDGDIWSGGEKLVLGDSCSVKGGIWSEQDVFIGQRCNIRSVIGRHITIGQGSKVGVVRASGNVSLADGVVIEQCEIEGQLILNNSATGEIQIQGMDSVVANRLQLQSTLRLRLQDQVVGPEHIFILANNQLLPYVSPQSDKGKIVISTLLDHELVKSIQG